MSTRVPASSGSGAPDPPNPFLNDGVLYRQKAEKAAEAAGQWKSPDMPEQAVADSERVSRFLETSETILEGVEQTARYLGLPGKDGGRPLLDVNRDGEEEDEEELKNKWAALVHDYEIQLQLMPKPVPVQAATEPLTALALVESEHEEGIENTRKRARLQAPSTPTSTLRDNSSMSLGAVELLSQSSRQPNDSSSFMGVNESRSWQSSFCASTNHARSMDVGSQESRLFQSKMFSSGDGTRLYDPQSRGLSVGASHHGIETYEAGFGNQVRASSMGHQVPFGGRQFSPFSAGQLGTLGNFPASSGGREEQVPFVQTHASVPYDPVSSGSQPNQDLLQMEQPQAGLDLMPTPLFSGGQFRQGLWQIEQPQAEMGRGSHVLSDARRSDIASQSLKLEATVALAESTRSFAFTVPIPSDGPLVWTRSVDMPVALVAELRTAFYGLIEDSRKLGRWKSYQIGDSQHCILTWIIGRGENKSEWGTAGECCSMCEKTFRICCTLIEHEGQMKIAVQRAKLGLQNQAAWDDIRHYGYISPNKI